MSTPSASRQPLTKEDIARRGDAIYDERVRPEIDEEADRGKFVAIDVETGDWELDADEMSAVRRLKKRQPEARGRLWLMRAGMKYSARLGGARSSKRNLS